MIKLSAGLLVLFIALALQFWLASAGVRVDLVFAALISFAYLFGFWELLLLVLLGVFIINWQPAPSVEILVFALFPLAAYFCRDLLHWRTWLENFLAIALGFLVLYLAVVPMHFLLYLNSFLLNVAAGIIFSAVIFFPLYRWGTE